MKRTRDRVKNAASSTTLAVRKRVQRPLNEEKSGRSIQPVGHEVDVSGRNEDGRCHGRGERCDHQRGCRQRGPHAARSTGTALELHELVQMVHRGRTMLIVADCVCVLVAGSAGLVRMMTAHRMVTRFSRCSHRSCQHPMMVRTAVDHGRRRQPLEGKREQHEPHQHRLETPIHGESVNRTAELRWDARLQRIRRQRKPCVGQGDNRPLFLLRAGRLIARLSSASSCAKNAGLQTS